jgi:ATP-dependent helicase/nuclease subunit B
VPLSLIAGPANAGKVALLLERYVERLDDDPVLIVPTRSDVDRVERELLARTGCLFGGSIGTFDDVFERVALGDPELRPVAGDAQRVLLVRRALGTVSLNGLGRSARFGGFADSLLQAVSELESGMLEPEALDGDLARLYGAYRAELDASGLWDRDLLRARAAARLESDLAAWQGQPVFAYGFEDLTAAEWRLVEALAGRADVAVSLPYEAGRTAFEALRDTAEGLATLARDRIEELPPRYGEISLPALAHVERALFVDAPPAAPPIEGAVRFLEAAGARGTLEAVADEILALARAGTAPEQIAVVCPSLERWRAPLETVFGVFGVPYRLEGAVRFSRVPLGAAVLSLLRFAWLGGARQELYGYLRSPFSGLARASVDFAEGRLRGRGIATPERVEEETERLRGANLPALDALRQNPSPIDGVRDLLRGAAGGAHGVGVPPATEAARLDLLAYERALRLLDELEDWQRRGGELEREDVVAALERLTIAPAAAERGRVLVTDHERARTRRLEVAFVLGLEEGSLPRRGGETPFLDDDERRRLGPRLRRADPVARDRYLFYTAATRASRRLYLVREAATDEGSPREPSPFWDELRGLFDADDVERATTRRPLSALTWPLEQAPSERERLRAVAVLAAADRDEAEAIARANGWERRLDRLTRAFDRPTVLSHPLVLETLGLRTTFNVTELERFADCSSAWFLDRLIAPKTIDAEVDAKLKGGVAHQALYKFFSGLPRELGTDRVRPERLDDAVRFMRTCLDTALQGVRMDMTDMQRRELDQALWRDLEAFVHAEAESKLPLEPHRFEVSFGSERSPQELQRGLDLGGVTLSGKIDRIDRDPRSARGIVIDYKSGRGAPSAAEIERELRLQVPLYMLVLRDLVGLEPLGGVYKPLAGDRRMRGLLRAEAADDGIPGFAPKDYLPDDAFWAQVEGARETARGLAERIRAGDVRHDPKGGECPSWCALWPMCRVRRA